MTYPIFSLLLLLPSLHKCIALLKTYFSLFQGQWFSISPHCLQNWGQTALFVIQILSYSHFTFFVNPYPSPLHVCFLQNTRSMYGNSGSNSTSPLGLFFLLHSFPHYFYHSSVYFKPKYHPSVVLVLKTTYLDPTKNKQVLLIFCVPWKQELS